MSSVIINGIYKHYKKGDFYKVKDIAFNESDGEAVVIYFRCDENGIYKSIRITDETFIGQPFCRPAKDFMGNVKISDIDDGEIKRFKFIKQI